MLTYKVGNSNPSASSKEAVPCLFSTFCFTVFPKVTPPCSPIKVDAKLNRQPFNGLLAFYVPAVILLELCCPMLVPSSAYGQKRGVVSWCNHQCQCHVHTKPPSTMTRPRTKHSCYRATRCVINVTDQSLSDWVPFRSFRRKTKVLEFVQLSSSTQAVCLFFLMNENTIN